VSDLTDEMRQLAADAATHARPMAVTEVIRRGNRRRTRTVAQRSIGGLSAVGLGAAVLFTGVTHHLGSNPAASGSVPGGNTVTVTSTSAAGSLTMAVKYLYRPAGRIKLVSVTYSGDSKKVKKNPILIITFGPGLDTKPNKPSQSFGIVLKLHASQLHHFSGSLAAKFLRTLNQHGRLAGNGSARIVLGSRKKLTSQPAHKKPVTDKVTQSMTAVVILTR